MVDAQVAPESLLILDVFGYARDVIRLAVIPEWSLQAFHTSFHASRITGHDKPTTPPRPGIRPFPPAKGAPAPTTDLSWRRCFLESFSKWLNGVEGISMK